MSLRSPRRSRSSIIPKSASGKILRRVLVERERAAQQR
jgi:acyl-CoA synthetase (AMP-forming)/AMP-acid ligase II